MRRMGNVLNLLLINELFSLSYRSTSAHLHKDRTALTGTDIHSHGFVFICCFIS